MKKQIILLVGLLFMSVVLKAQERDQGTIEIIPSIGYAVSFLNGDEIDGLGSRDAVQFGITGDYYFSDRWSLRLGLSYFPMGAAIPRYELQLDYLNIPINANWHFGSHKNWNLNFGVAPGFLVKGSLNGENVKASYDAFQLAISYGLGYKIALSDNFSILLHSQGVFGVTNSIEDSDDFTRLNAGSSFNIGGVFTF